MEDLESIGIHQRAVGRLVPLLGAMQSIAEIAWRRIQVRFQPLEDYSYELQRMLEQLFSTLDGEQRQLLQRPWQASETTAVLLIGSERGLCGPFNERLVSWGLKYIGQLSSPKRGVQLFCLGTRGKRALESAGGPVRYFRSLPSLSAPTYADMEEVAVDLVEMLEQGYYGRLIVVHNAPAQRFQYQPASRTLVPPAISIPERQNRQIIIKPATDVPALATHILTEYLLNGVYRAALESAFSEQLARMYTMRLAVEKARGLVDRLTLEYNLARRQDETASLLETIVGYQATAAEGSEEA